MKTPFMTLVVCLGLVGSVAAQLPATLSIDLAPATRSTPQMAGYVAGDQANPVPPTEAAPSARAKPKQPPPLPGQP